MNYAASCRSTIVWYVRSCSSLHSGYILYLQNLIFLQINGKKNLGLNHLTWIISETTSNRSPIFVTGKYSQNRTIAIDSLEDYLAAYLKFARDFNKCAKDFFPPEFKSLWININTRLSNNVTAQRDSLFLNIFGKLILLMRIPRETESLMMNRSSDSAAKHYEDFYEMSPYNTKFNEEPRFPALT